MQNNRYRFPSLALSFPHPSPKQTVLAKGMGGRQSEKVIKRKSAVEICCKNAFREGEILVLDQSRRDATGSVVQLPPLLSLLFLLLFAFSPALAQGAAPPCQQGVSQHRPVGAVGNYSNRSGTSNTTHQRGNLLAPICRFRTDAAAGC